MAGHGQTVVCSVVLFRAALSWRSVTSRLHFRTASCFSSARKPNCSSLCIQDSLLLLPGLRWPLSSLVALLEPILCFPLLDAESLGFICPCDLLTGGSGSVEAVAFLVIFLSNLLLDWLLFVDFPTRSALSFSLYIFISTHTQIYIHKQGSCCRKQIAVERGQNDTVLAAAPER